MKKQNIIDRLRDYLIEENLYTSKDEITLLLLENTYRQYNLAYKDVKKNGNTIVVNTYYKGTAKTTTNPAFNNMLHLQKELFKLLDSLYLTPKSRQETKDKNKVDEKDPFVQMINEIKNIEKR